MGEINYFAGDLFRPVETDYGVQKEIGRGSDHVVLNIPYFDRLEKYGLEGASRVWKCNMRSLRTCNSGTIEENIAAVTALAEKRVQQYHWLKTIFGDEIVPNQETTVEAIWLPSDDVARIWPDGDAPRPSGVFHCIVVVQDRVRAIEDTRNVLELRLPYAEWADSVADNDVYAALNHRWVTNADDLDPPTSKEIAQFLEVQQTPWTQQILGHIAWLGQHAVRGALERLVSGSVQYGNTYGQTLDYAGKENAIITMQGAAKLIDPFVPPDTYDLRDLPRTMRTVQNNFTHEQRTWAVLLNGLGFTRNMNFLSAWLGLPERILPEFDQAPRLRDWKKIRELLIQSSPDNTIRR